MSFASHFRPAVLLFACILLEGCGAYFVGFVSNPGGSQTISGTVNTVQLSSFQNFSDETVVCTQVTFLNSDTATTINFCGDQQSKFPQGRQVRADFNSGLSCSILVAVTVTA